jgi:hypothetical protein
MNRMRYPVFAALVVAALFAVTAGSAFATPAANSIVVPPRIFNDCPTATRTVIDNDFALVSIEESVLDCVGGLNRNAWDLSVDNANPLDFVNGDKFSYCATIVVTGSGNGEAGLRLSPWWSLEVDGVFMLNTGSGEIACFGGRLPFYSFTGNYAQTYTKGEVVTLQIDYDPHSLTAADPGTIVYTLTNSSGTYSSGPLAFDEGNPSENPPHGLWGILQPAHAGGYMQAQMGGPGNPTDLKAEFRNICFDAGPTPAEPTTFGKIKSIYR